MKQLLLLSLLSLSSFCMEIGSDVLRKNAALAHAKLIYDKEHFVVDEDGQRTIVQRYNMNRELRSLSQDQVKNIIKSKNALLYLRVLSDKSYALELEGKLHGGLGIAAIWAYQITRGLLYGATAAAGATLVTAGILSTAGLATPALAPVITVLAPTAGKLVSVGIGLAASAAGTPLAVTATTAIAGTAIASTLATTVAASEIVVTGSAIVGTAGGPAGYILMVEGIATFVGSLFAVCPWLP